MIITYLSQGVLDNLISPIRPSFGVVAPLLGRLADARGIPATFVVVAALIVLALVVVSILPAPRSQTMVIEASAR